MVTRSTALPPNAAEFVVHEWIGIEQGQLLEFTHSELIGFFRRYASLPDSHPGVLRDAGPLEGFGPTKRDRFIQALDSGTTEQQLAILRGVLQRLPVDPAKGRTHTAADKINSWIYDLEHSLNPANVEVDDSALALPDVARLALEAARRDQGRKEEYLALDRIHTALHAYVKRLAEEIGFDTDTNEKLRDQFGAVRKRHPAFQVEKGDRPAADVLQGLAKAVEGLNAARNKNTLAHPAESLLDEAEARLLCNAGMTLLQYILDRSEAYRLVDLAQPKVKQVADSFRALSDPDELFASFDWPTDTSSNGTTVEDPPWDDPLPFGDPEPAAGLEGDEWESASDLPFE